MKRQESVYTLELIILIHDAVSVIIRVLVIFKTITIIILISIQDAITVIILILFIGQSVSIIVLIVISNTVTIIIIILVIRNSVIVIIIYSVSETILVRVNITPEGGDGASEEAEAQQEEDLVHVSVVWTQSCPLIPH